MKRRSFFFFLLWLGLSSGFLCDPVRWGLTAPGVWRKHKWSCCQSGGEGFVVATASAGHESKRPLGINDFSLGWWAEAGRFRGGWVGGLTGILCFPLTKTNGMMGSDKHPRSFIYQMSLCCGDSWALWCGMGLKSECSNCLPKTSGRKMHEEIMLWSFSCYIFALWLHSTS